MRVIQPSGSVEVFRLFLDPRPGGLFAPRSMDSGSGSACRTSLMGDRGLRIPVNVDTRAPDKYLKPSHTDVDPKYNLLK